ncbi:MAG: hypothetical protein FWG74_09275 [Planctomycetes bacterium]|nr:hypothetical protein [Planctomycetota bacterium]
MNAQPRLYDKFSDIYKAFREHDQATVELKMRITEMFEEYANWRVKKNEEDAKKMEAPMKEMKEALQ